MKRSALFFLTAVLALAPAANAAIVTKAVEYKHGEAVLEGFLAYDDAVQGKRPGVVVVHEWKGLGDYAKDRAKQLAGLGYTAFAIDMYGKGIYAKDHEEAALFSGLYRNDRALMRARAKAGLDTLLAEPTVDASRVAAIGYCFGGTTVLEMARAGEPLKLVASFHGGLGTPVAAKAGEISSKVVVFQGAEDKFTLTDLEPFKAEMRAANADWTVVELGGAVHSFTVPEAGNDPSQGMAYNAAADKRSWDTLKVFLNEVFA